MSAAMAALPGGAYLVNLAEEHASARGYQFDEPGRNEFRGIADQGIETAHEKGVYTVEDIQRDVAPNTILLTDSIIVFAEGILLTVKAVKEGFRSICPLFPFC